MKHRTTLPVVVSLLSLCTGAAALAQAPPAGFSDAHVADIPAPTSIAFTPDGRILVTSQPGRVFVIDVNGAVLSTPALDLSASICANSERGLLGIALDPLFASNGFIYTYYTFKGTTACANSTPGKTPVNRVSRFTMTGNTVNPASQTVLIDNIPSFGGAHNAGDLHFGKDGYLYISVGDGLCDYTPNRTGCSALNAAARYQYALVGKILRITKTGGIPASNPFQGPNSVRCNVTGAAQPGQICQEIFAWGLRNPFRIAFDPNATGTRFFINDVGQNRWEEIDEGKAGADYGWNVREGPCPTGTGTGSGTSCPAPPAGMTNPIYWYLHVTGGCEAITGGAFVPAGVWPPQYDGAYMFADYDCGSIFVLTRSSTGTYSRTTFMSGLGVSSAVGLAFGPYGGTQALYYLTYANGGQVRRITATSGNRPPTASATASPRSGPVPLAVQFNASASSDPDGDTLSFDWNFGDGSAHATTAVVSHTYTTVGRFTATVTVADGHGHTGVASVTIDAGNRPPTATITSPSGTARFAVGQTITLTGSASDPEEGAVPAARLTWEVLLHHNSHTHPWLQPTAGNNLTIQAPAPEDLAATTTSYLEIRLTAADSQGASSTVRRDMQPRLVNVTLDSIPAGLTLSANDTTVTTPKVLTSWEGYTLALRAPTQRDTSGQPWLFASWSDGGAASHTVVTPAALVTFTATFTGGSAAGAAADTYARGGAYAGQNFGTALTLQAKKSSTPDTAREAFLRFALPSQQVGRAVLRLHGGTSANTADIPIAIYPVADTTWSETGLTWNTRPASGTSALASVVIKGTARIWYEWDVTSYVQSRITAGATAISFSLTGTSATPPFASFSAREATANRPELITTAPASAPPGDIVLYAADATQLAGAWRLVSESTAAAGIRAHHPDAGAAKLTAPLAAPTHWAEWSFTAQKGRPYRLWIRGKADANSTANDSLFVQFSGSVTSTGAATYRIGSTSATRYILEECLGCGVSGWGWEDNGYERGVLGPPIYFAADGPQRIRIQTREDGLSIDQILLLSGTHMNVSPGSTKNDNTIVPKP